jgi:hypothetical protein
MNGLWPRLTNALEWRLRMWRFDAQFFPVRFEAWAGAQRKLRRYRLLSEHELRATRRSDTVFVFGSGHSLNAITAEEWHAIAEHDTFGFNWFVHQKYVRCDYHLVREIGPTDLDPTLWRQYLYDYFDRLRSNPCFADSVLLIQRGFRATNGNRALWLELIPPHQKIFRWKSIDDLAPSDSFAKGLSHGHGTLSQCVNFAVLMGWRNIVLTGVDLYDRRYFWLGADQPRPDDPKIDTVHATALAGIVESIGSWSAELRPRGVSLYTYNPRSLLNTVLPVWTRSAA